MRLLERIGLADKADAYPNKLSGGQKQRIADVYKRQNKKCLRSGLMPQAGALFICITAFLF